MQLARNFFLLLTLAAIYEFPRAWESTPGFYF
jgi:hypothetical protein